MQAEALAFGQMRGEITSARFDVNYWRLSALVKSRLSNALYPLRYFGELVQLVQYGCSKLASSEPIGVPIVRMNNLQANEWDFTDLKWVELSERELETYRLQQEDLLFNRTNSKELVGKCEVFREPAEWVFASYLIRVRTNDLEISPQFASDFLNAPTGRLQIDQLSRQIIGMTNINAEEIKSIGIPLPSPERQEDLVAAMDAARVARRAKLAEADALLAGLDGDLRATLGLTPPPKDERKIFAVLRGDVDQRKIGASLYAPELRVFLHALGTSSFSMRKLSEEVAINPTISLEGLVEDSLVSFVPMEAVEEQAAGGVKLQTRKLSEVRKGYTSFTEGDVLWAKITPCMENGKSCVAKGLTNGVGFGSTEFHVLRPMSSRVTAEYVHEFISQSALRRVARFAFTGSAGHQRVPSDFLGELPFPVPPLDVQERIAAEARHRREEARRLRAEAETGWQNAKGWFDEQLLGPAQS